uniref:Fatty acid amide hydrolase isoform X3 n=1 Tax=Elaeis guineensis var. tenera TaxID=51953 RepID=A0A6I9QG84_ELAGV|nr:fatty acid amide hydrolase isoform X3 [Elaeis guineensis]
MGNKKRVMMPVEEIDVSAVKYRSQKIQAPHLTGFTLRLFVWLIETPPLGSLITSFLKRQNRITEMLQNTVIPERPMFRPEFPPQEPELGVVLVDENRDPVARLETATECLTPYDPSQHWSSDSTPFLYWTIRDYAYAYRSKITTPSVVAEHIISALEESSAKKPPVPMLISFSAGEVRTQAAASTNRILEGKPLSVLDGIFMAIKDDIDCYPYLTKGATTWFHKVRAVTQDAVCVSRLRSCGVIFIGKANMHELGLGTTGNNPNYGSLCDCGTVEVVSPLAATVEDTMLVYAAMAGSSPADRISLKPSPLCLPNLSSSDNLTILQSFRLGKYTEWFNDVSCNDISNKCEDVLNLLSDAFGCQMIEIVLPELEEMRTAHIVSIGSETMCSLGPDCVDGRCSELTLDTRISLALFRSFSAAEYVAAQRLRRRIMYYHMEVFKKVDMIVTPTTGITAPEIPLSSLRSGETDYKVSGYLMRFILAGNLLGLPAISVPIGHDKQGLPIGLQLIGRPWGEASILRVASALEGLCSGFRKKPSKFCDVLKAI